MVEYQEKRALIPIVKTERDIKVEFLKHFYDEISVYVLLSRVHVHNLHPGCKFAPGSKFTPGCKFAPLMARSYSNKLCSYAPRFD